MSPPASIVRLPRIATLSWDDCRLLVESVVDYAIFMLDADGFVATWNLGAERMKGYKAEEIIGQHFSTFFLPEDVEAGKPERELAIAAEQGRTEEEGWRVRKDGSRFWANVVITALRGEDGSLRGFGKVTRDLTQRRLAHEELRRSEERFHLLVDAVPDYAIFMLDETGHVTTWNRGAEKIKGYAASEIIGRHFSVFYTTEDRDSGRAERNLEMARRDGRIEDEGWRVRKDGSRFWANAVITPLRDEHGTLLGFAKVTRDLTARRQVEEAEHKLLREQAARDAAERVAKESAEASRLKDEFLATVSHELRTPLNAIMGWSTMLRKRDLDAGLAKAIEVIDRNARAQVKIVEDLLDVSRIITGKLRLDLKPVDLVEVTSAAIEVLRPSVLAKRITVQFDPGEPTCLLVGDAERLQQVVWNLVSNAAKFTNSGGSIRITIDRDGSRVELSVTDTGRGIDPGFLPFVFDRFRQGDPSITRRFSGLGLGLALVRHIVELHGGTVGAESEGIGKGATFTVTLPVRAVAPQTVGEQPSSPRLALVHEEPATALHGIRVLVVDDDADARDLLETVLTEHGAIVETAGSAAEGMTSFRDFRPHVLVSDIGMPEEDGYSLMRHVRALGPAEGGAVPSIALTAYTRAEERTRALAAGFTNHLGKPVEPNDLVLAIANLASLGRR